MLLSILGSQWITSERIPWCSYRGALFVHLLHIWAMVELIHAAPVNKKHFRQTILVDDGFSFEPLPPSRDANDVVPKSPCSEAEFYDGVVQKCSLCSDVCYDKMADPGFCANNCPDYFRTKFLKDLEFENSANISQQRSSTVLHFKYSVLSSTSHEGSPIPEGSTLNPQGNMERFIDQPLFWTSMISLFISICSTVVIVVLCVRRAHFLLELRRRRRGGLVFRRGGGLPQTQTERELDGFSSKKIHGDSDDGGLLHHGNLNSEQLPGKTQHDGSNTRKLDGLVTSLSNHLNPGRKASPVPRQGEEQGALDSMPSHPQIRVHHRSSLVDKAPVHNNDQHRNQHNTSSFQSSLNDDQYSVAHTNAILKIPVPVSDDNTELKQSDFNLLNTTKLESCESVISSPNFMVDLSDKIFRQILLRSRIEVIENPLATFDDRQTSIVNNYLKDGSHRTQKLSPLEECEGVHPSADMGLTSTQLSNWSRFDS